MKSFSFFLAGKYLMNCVVIIQNKTHDAFFCVSGDGFSTFSFIFKEVSFNPRELYSIAVSVSKYFYYGLSTKYLEFIKIVDSPDKHFFKVIK